MPNHPPRLGDVIERAPHPRGDLLIIDRTQTGLVLPDDQGVGLARKIGADVALAVWAGGGIESPWIHCSDADVVFPADYFRRSLAAGPALLVVTDFTEPDTRGRSERSHRARKSFRCFLGVGATRFVRNAGRHSRSRILFSGH